MYHYTDVTMNAKASQITSPTIVYSIVHSGADQRKHQSPASLAFVRGIHRWPVNSPVTSPRKRPVTRKMFPFDDVIMFCSFTLRPRQNGQHFSDDIFKAILMKTCVCWGNFTEICFQASIGSDNGLVPNRRQSIIRTNDGLFCRCIYASLDLNESAV